MGVIRILPEHEVHKIAAGEVVERPASVVKELLENALDAGATQISIAITGGGSSCIRITDNGCGMDPEDARECLKNHATSKIASVDDLERVSTFGFRGEALASISAVSRCEMRTRTASNATGLMLTIEAGQIVAETAVSCPIGTDIAIRDLFFNMPARQKFLKKDETEWRAIQQLTTACALQENGVNFTLMHNDRPVFRAPAVATRIERIAQLFGAPFARDVLVDTFADERARLEIEVAIARTNHHRYDRSQIYLFINRRPVKNHKLANAIIKGYNNVLPTGQYPIAVLSLSIDSAEVDVNIHPRKEEVRLAHPFVIEQAVQELVAKLLREDVPLATAAPKDTMSYRPARPYEPPCAPLGTPHVPQRCVSTCPFREPVGQIQFAPDRDLEPNTEQLVLPDQPRYRLLGQLLNTYIVVEEDEGIVLIDQHAAHERILYELFADRFSGKSSTQLLFPLIITLPHDEAAIFVDQLAQFRSYGIDIEPFGSHAFTIRSVPVYLKDAPFESIIRTFIAWCTEEQGVAKADFAELLIEKLQALMACKAAIKAGDQLSNEQMHALISKLMRCHSRTICAHGRPTTHRLSKYEIEKIFQRCG